MGGLSEAALASADPVHELNLRILKLEHRLARERAARLQAEAIAEKGLSELYEKQQQLVLLETIATMANQSRSVEETLRFAVGAICRHTGWAFGSVHLMEAEGVAPLAPAKIWHAENPLSVEGFIEITQKSHFEAGRGLPGRILDSGRPAWIADVADDPNFPRAAEAKACGLHAAFGAPVLVGHEVQGVLEFFNTAVLAPDEQLLSVAGQVGIQLGRVIERKRAEEQLMHDASHDPLTGLPNRLLFSDRLARAVATFNRRADLGFAVLFIDLDRFKLVNDSLGHAAGDVLLVEIAARFSAVLDDARGGDGRVLMATLARLGGDEFTVLIEDNDDTEVAVALGAALQDALRRPLVIDGQDVFTSASIGIASSVAGYACVADIMRDADLAMYRAKTEGRGRIEIFDQSLHDEAKRRLTLESDLRNALRRKEFVLHYQPIVALDSGRLTGFEALVRWRRDSGELVPPGEFIDIAEETGLIVFLGQWVMQEAFRTLAEWERRYPGPTPLSMSVNVSPRQFHQPDFVEQVIQAIESSGARPEAIRLEITEGVTIQNAPQTKAILERLRAYGVRVSIDDFGTGYSSLSYLQQLPFDTLKIDRSFIAALKADSNSEDIVRTILDLAKNLKMDVVAEGAETQAHVDQLRELGCGYAQGYFFSHPVDGAEAEALLGKAPR